MNDNDKSETYNMEKAVETCAKIYECRRELQCMLGDEYQKRVDKLKHVVRTEAKLVTGGNIIAAGLSVVRRLDKFRHAATTRVLIMCAAVEIIETEAI